MHTATSEINDLHEIRDLALRYAQAVDRRDAELLGDVFMEDGLLDGSGYRTHGRDKIMKIAPMMAKRYEATMHTVHNHRIELNGDEATGEVYAMSHHLTKQEDGSLADWVMMMRYHDSYVRDSGRWLFAHRHILVDWTETREAQAFPPAQ